jgi:hypothetical protein
MPLRRLALVLVTASLLALPASAEEPTQEKAEPLLRAVLSRVIAVGDYLPDRVMLPADPPFLLMEEVASTRLKITRPTIPETPGWFKVRPFAKLQEKADTSKKTLFFVVIRRVSVTGESATLEVGVDVVYANQQGGTKYCCCTARDQYVREKGGWRFAKREATICA